MFGVPGAKCRALRWSVVVREQQARGGVATAGSRSGGFGLLNGGRLRSWRHTQPGTSLLYRAETGKGKGGATEEIKPCGRELADGGEESVRSTVGTTFT